jgi:RHS repeat-associated protein
MTGASQGGTYAYDGLGRRTLVQSTDGSTRLHIYGQDGKLQMSTSSGGGRPTGGTLYFYLGDKQIAEWDSVRGTQFVHSDALGSPVARTTITGAGSVVRTRFEAYGAVAQGSKPGPTLGLLGFSGHVQDSETDLVYMQQRYYDPLAGRFLSVDPVVTDVKTGDHFNRYVYAENNPYKYTDPDGEAPRDLGPAGGSGGSSVGPGFSGGGGSAGRGSASPSQGNGATVINSQAARGLSQNAASREAKREAGIPTSQQPVSQTNGKVTDSRTGEQVSVGRQQTYEVPKPGGGTETMSVQVSRDTQGAHKGMPQIEAGKVKPGGQTDAAGRPRIQNEDKVRVDIAPRERH